MIATVEMSKERIKKAGNYNVKRKAVQDSRL